MWADSRLKGRDGRTRQGGKDRRAAVDRRAAKDCPDLDNNVVQGGELMPSSLMDITLPTKSEGLEPRDPHGIWTDEEGSGELTCTLLFPLPRLR